MEKHNSKTASLALVGLIAVFVIAALLIYGVFKFYLPDLWKAFSTGDKQAMEQYIANQSMGFGCVLLWLLTFVQVLSIVIPAMPVQLVAGMTCGIVRGFIISFSASVCANMFVLWFATKANSLLTCIATEHPKINKTLNILKVEKNRTFYTVLALLTPALPNGAIPYAAANSQIKPQMFFAALIFALPFPTLLTCIAGKMIVVGRWKFSILLIVILYALVAALLANKKSITAIIDKYKKNIDI